MWLQSHVLPTGARSSGHALDPRTCGPSRKWSRRESWYRAPSSRSVAPDQRIGRLAPVRTATRGTVRAEQLRHGERVYDPRRPTDRGPGCTVRRRGSRVTISAWSSKVQLEVTGDDAHVPGVGDVVEVERPPVTSGEFGEPSWIPRRTSRDPDAAPARRIIDRRYVCAADVVAPDGSVVVLESPCETGKTTLLRQVLRPAERSLVIGPRVALREDLVHRLGISRITKEDPDGAGLACCCIESLLSAGRDFDAVVLEEVETTLREAASSICGQLGPVILRRLRDLGEGAHRIIVMDAHISDRTLRALRRLWPDRDVVHVENVHEHGRSVALYPTGTELRRALVADVAGQGASILDKVDTGRRQIAVGCASAGFARALARDLRREFPDKSIVVATRRETRMGDWDASCLEACDVLVYTSTIGLGHDLQSREWSRVYMFAGAHMPVRDLLQMMVRVRQPRDREVRAHVPDHHEDLPRTVAEIDEAIRTRMELAKRILAVVLSPYGRAGRVEDWADRYYPEADRVDVVVDDLYHQHLLDVLVERNTELADYRGSFSTIARRYGWHVAHEDTPPAEVDVASLRAAARESEREILDVASTAAPLDPDLPGTEALVDQIRDRERSRAMTSSDAAMLDRMEVEQATGPGSLDEDGLREHLAETGVQRGVQQLRELAEVVASYERDGCRAVVHEDGETLLGDAPEHVRLQLRRALMRRIYLRAWGIDDLRDPESWRDDRHRHRHRRALVPPRRTVLEVLGMASHREAAEALGVAVTEQTTHGDLLARVLGRLGLRRCRARKVRGVICYAIDRERYEAQMGRVSWLVARTLARGMRLEDNARAREVAAAEPVVLDLDEDDAPRCGPPVVFDDP